VISVTGILTESQTYLNQWFKWKSFFCSIDIAMLCLMLLGCSCKTVPWCCEEKWRWFNFCMYGDDFIYGWSSCRIDVDWNGGDQTYSWLVYPNANSMVMHLVDVPIFLSWSVALLPWTFAAFYMHQPFGIRKVLSDLFVPLVPVIKDGSCEPSGKVSNEK